MRSRPLNFPFGEDTPAGAAAAQAQKAPNAIVVGPCAEFTKGPYKKRGGVHTQRQAGQAKEYCKYAQFEDEEEKLRRMEEGTSHAIPEANAIPGPYKAPASAPRPSDLNFSQFNPHAITEAIHMQQDVGTEHPLFKYEDTFNGSISGISKAGQVDSRLDSASGSANQKNNKKRSKHARIVTTSSNHEHCSTPVHV